MTDPAYFEHLYRTDPDPWLLDSAPYEERKRELTLASLPRPQYRRAFEPACAAGQITRLLARRCDGVVAMDPVDLALERLGQRALDRVDARLGAIPQDWPEGTFDLVVLSEVLYFLSPEDRALTARRTVESLTDDGQVLAVHWRHDFDEAASRPDDAHADLHAAGLRGVVTHVERDFRLEVLERA